MTRAAEVRRRYRAAARFRYRLLGMFGGLAVAIALIATAGCGHQAVPRSAAVYGSAPGQAPSPSAAASLSPTPSPSPSPVPPAKSIDLAPIMVSLRWDNDNDEDLHVTQPDGTQIQFFSRGPTATGGYLDRDDNVAACGGDDVSSGEENVLWPTGTGPTPGTYHVEVVEYETCSAPAHWTLEVMMAGQMVTSQSGSGPTSFDVTIPVPAANLPEPTDSSTDPSMDPEVPQPDPIEEPDSSDSSVEPDISDNFVPPDPVEPAPVPEFADGE